MTFSNSVAGVCFVLFCSPYHPQSLYRIHHLFLWRFFSVLWVPGNTRFWFSSFFSNVPFSVSLRDPTSCVCALKVGTPPRISPLLCLVLSHHFSLAQFIHFHSFNHNLKTDECNCCICDNSWNHSFYGFQFLSFPPGQKFQLSQTKKTEDFANISNWTCSKCKDIISTSAHLPLTF